MTTRRKSARKNRRVRNGRRTYTRRKSDFYYELGKFCGLIATVAIAIIGQAELIGEPWRHYVTVTAIVTTAVWAYGTHPQSMKVLLRTFKARNR